ncbi:hypothetical protein JCM10450v2_006259 [Rhodotorula kratochvilovae]
MPAATVRGARFEFFAVPAVPPSLPTSHFAPMQQVEPWAEAEDGARMRTAPAAVV